MKKGIAVFSCLFLAGCTKSAPAVDITFINQTIGTQYFDDSMMEVDQKLAADLLMLENETSVCVGFTSVTEEVNEFMICQDSEEIRSKLEERVQYHVDSAERYHPELVEMLEAGVVKQIDDCWILAVGAQAEEITSSVEELVK